MENNVLDLLSWEEAVYLDVGCFFLNFEFSSVHIGPDVMWGLLQF